MNAKKIATAGIGIALYVAISMLLKIPLGVGHIMLDLGYIVFAIYCYIHGSIIGAIVGTGGCILVSLLSTGYFPIGWALGNAFIGVVCGRVVDRPLWARVVIAVIAVLIGVAGIKTIVESAIWSMPILVKLAKNLVAASADAAVMAIGTYLAPKVKNLVSKSVPLD